jgi:phosphofructokinase-like protein
MTKKIAISTGGGDAPGLNAVIRAVVRTAIKKHGWEVYGIEDGFEGLIYPSKTGRHPARTRRLRISDVRGILPKGGTILGTTNRGNPFDFPIGTRSKTVTKDMSGKLIRNFRKLRLDALITIGGDGTLSIAQRLFEKGLPIVGVPKTIDNDLSATDVTFGFNTAVSIVTEALDRLHTTAESHHRIIVVEVMGRHAGWIALEAGIAGGADAIVIPEIPFHIGKICDHISARKAAGSRFSIVVAAEGAAPKGGQPIYLDSVSKLPDGSKRLGGIGYWLAGQLSLCSGLESRVVVLGHLQRGGSPTTFDRFLATRFGVAAVELVAQKKFGYMTCLEGRRVESVTITSAISKLKRVKPNGELVTVAEDLGISMGR